MAEGDEGFAAHGKKSHLRSQQIDARPTATTMKRRNLATLCLAVITSATLGSQVTARLRGSPPAASARQAPRPNIVFILADDLGHADVGFNGGREIATPNIDQLAAAGARLDQFYAQQVCSPTRAA